MLTKNSLFSSNFPFFIFMKNKFDSYLIAPSFLSSKTIIFFVGIFSLLLFLKQYLPFFFNPKNNLTPFNSSEDVSKIKSSFLFIAILLNLYLYSSKIIKLFNHWVLIISFSIEQISLLKSLSVQNFDLHSPFILIGLSFGQSLFIKFMLFKDIKII